MNTGIGDFLVVNFNSDNSSWKDMVLNGKTVSNKFNLNSNNLFDITESIKAIVHGDVSIDKDTYSNLVEISVNNILGKTSANDFIENKSNKIYGKFALLKINTETNEINAYTDATRQVALYSYTDKNIVAIATDIRLFYYIETFNKDIDTQAIYHHLNFSYIPTPYTIYKNVSKIPPGTVVAINRTDITSTKYWKPEYPEDYHKTEDELVEELEAKIIETIAGYQSDNHKMGCFLSGGTDSSTITGVISRTIGGENTHAYSIGFNEKGYDELEYAEIAASSFSVNHHYMRIGLTDTVSAIQSLILNSDEPFGNSSAIPTYYCAQLAKDDGRSTLLGGDGGDEIFGGNERYAKDYYFNLFYSLPGPLKTLSKNVASRLKPFDTRLTNRINNYINRASLPNPERFYTDDSFASDYFNELLTNDFRKDIDKDSSLRILEGHYTDCSSHNELNRLMYIDLQMAISDNDLKKVNSSASAAGISVLYPYLTPDLIQFMGHIPHSLKVNKTKKRYLFKKAVDTILPEKIKVKKKQGFGLPVGEWFRHDKEFKSFLVDTLLSSRSIERGYFNKEFLANLISMHEKGTWDYTQELWLLLTLELWHQEYIDA